MTSETDVPSSSSKEDGKDETNAAAESNASSSASVMVMAPSASATSLCLTLTCNMLGPFEWDQLVGSSSKQRQHRLRSLHGGFEAHWKAHSFLQRLPRAAAHWAAVPSSSSFISWWIRAKRLEIYLLLKNVIWHYIKLFIHKTILKAGEDIFLQWRLQPVSMLYIIIKLKISVILLCTYNKAEVT